VATRTVKRMPFLVEQRWTKFHRDQPLTTLIALQGCLGVCNAMNSSPPDPLLRSQQGGLRAHPWLGDSHPPATATQRAFTGLE